MSAVFDTAYRLGCKHFELIMPTPIIGAQFSVDIYAPAAEGYYPTVAAGVDGRFGIAFHKAANGYQFNRFDADGTARNEGRQVGFTPSELITNRIEMVGTQDNNYTLAYVDPLNDGDIFTVTYRADGSSTAAVNQSLINNRQAGAEGSPSIAISPAGGSFVFFVDAVTDFGLDVIMSTPNYQSYSGLVGDQTQVKGTFASGRPVRVYVDETTNSVRLDDSNLDGRQAIVLGDGYRPHVANLADGCVAVTWTGADDQIYVSMVDVDGQLGPAARTAPINVDPGATDVSEASVTGLEDGRSLVVWLDELYTGIIYTGAIKGRLLNADGTPDSDVFVIDSMSSKQSVGIGAPRAAQLADGRVVVTYQDGVSADSDVVFRILDPRTGPVSVAGSFYDDDHVGSAYGDTFIEGDGNDRARGGGGDDQIFGGTGSDSLYGDAGIDTLHGDVGNDMLDGGSNADRLFGGKGDDVYRVNDVGDVITEAAGGGLADRVIITASYTLTAGAEIELFSTNSGGSVVAIDLTGNALKQTIIGNAGVNVLSTGGGAADTMQGLAGNDTYRIYNAGDVIVETASQGTGDRVSSSVDYALGNGVYVEIMTTNGSTGTSAIDLTGNAFQQEIVGNAGANTLHDGGAGEFDLMRGFGGNDTYRVFNSGDVIVESTSQGNADRVIAAVDYKLGGGVDIEILQTNGSTGTSAIDLTGNEFGQQIIGNAGANRIEGKGGIDTLRGGSGADTFVFASTLGAANVDKILDFSVPADRMLLSDAIFTELDTGTLSASAFRANNTGLAQDSSDQIIYERDTGKLFYDADGAGGSAGIHFATLTVGLALTNTDFSVA